MKTTVTGTQEWAASNVNVIAGCANDCWYCYARQMAARFGRKSPADWANEQVNASVATKRWMKRAGTIMFPTSHDIRPDNLDVCQAVLRRLLEAGNKVLVVSKPHKECIRRLCKDLVQYRHQILFRFTLGSTRNDVLRLWEPGAPGFAERLAALRYAHAAGYRTSVSCEPMLDDRPDDLVAAVAPYVNDAIWLGRANALRSRLRMNEAPAAVLAAGEALLRLQTDKWIRALYRRLRHRPNIKFKDSIKKVVGLDRPTEKGLDV